MQKRFEETIVVLEKEKGFIHQNQLQAIELSVLALMSFLIPLSIGQPQLLVGTLVNAALIYGALRLRVWQLIPLIILPSIAIVMRGTLLGTITTTGLLILPIIWIGNLALVLCIKKIQQEEQANGNKEKKQTNKQCITKNIKTITLSALVKTSIITSLVIIFTSFNILPNSLLFAMSIMQLVTAISGGSVAFLVSRMLHQ